MMKSVMSLDESTISKPFQGGLLDLGSQSLHEQIHGHTDESVQAMIAERERKFFKEISLNPQLKDQHPLMHLITAQQKLQLVDQQSGVLMSKAASAKEGIFGIIYGKQPTERHQKFGPYGAELPYAINGEIVLPSTLRDRKQAHANAEKERKKTALKKLIAEEEEEELQKQQSKTGDTSVAQSSVKSSKQYRDFLSDSLQRIEAELGEAVGYPPLLDEVNDSATNTKASSSRKTSTVSNRAMGSSRRKRHASSAPGLNAPPLSPLTHDSRDVSKDEGTPQHAQTVYVLPVNIPQEDHGGAESLEVNGEVSGQAPDTSEGLE
ncbi:hypothetical protein EON65_35075 [archaeon]|nr:MAG: hypothetical protein EON65_35075 [archaeon]